MWDNNVSPWWKTSTPRHPAEPPSFQPAHAAERTRIDATICGPDVRPEEHALKLPSCLVLLLALPVVSPAWADCIDDAADRHGVHPHVLRAIGWHESRLRPEAEALNRNGTRDIGAFQINSIHLPRLVRHGIDARALKDGCVSSEVAAWHYRQQVDRHGNTWRAVGAYHSNTPARAAWYANAIVSVLMRWRVVPAGPLPYPAAATLAPRRSAAPALASLPAAAPLDAPVFDDGALLARSTSGDTLASPP
ncbi:lytic transglycosylase [Piscinibacter gummiphilus]|nr:lytic transglycosylase [Piscinibacter gummiphilus]